MTVIWDFLIALFNGVVTAGAIALIGWLYLYWRNKKMERAIRRSVERDSAVDSIDGWGVSIQNDTHVPITIRRVSLRTIAVEGHPDLKPGEENGHLRFNYRGPRESMAKRNSKSTEDERGFVQLPAYTGGVWLTNWGDDGKLSPPFPSCEFSHIEIEIEYLTLLRWPKIFLVTRSERGGWNGILRMRAERRKDSH